MTSERRVPPGFTFLVILIVLAASAGVGIPVWKRRKEHRAAYVKYEETIRCIEGGFQYSWELDGHLYALGQNRYGGHFLKLLDERFPLLAYNRQRNEALYFQKHYFVLGDQSYCYSLNLNVDLAGTRSGVHLPNGVRPTLLQASGNQVSFLFVVDDELDSAQYPHLVESGTYRLQFDRDELDLLSWKRVLSRFNEAERASR